MQVEARQPVDVAVAVPASATVADLAAAAAALVPGAPQGNPLMGGGDGGGGGCNSEGGGDGSGASGVCCYLDRAGHAIASVLPPLRALAGLRPDLQVSAQC